MNVAIFFVIGIAVVVQLTAAHPMQALGAPFNFVLAGAVLSGFFYGNYRGVAIAVFVAGLVLDAYSGAPYGTITAGLLAATTVPAVLSGVVPREHFLHFLLYSIAWTLSFYGTALITMKAANFSFSIPWTAAARAIMVAIAGMVVLYGIYQWSILLKNRRNGR